MAKLKPGDWVIYRKSKSSSSPGPRARKVFATKRGETYSYVVDKYWLIQSRVDDRTFLLSTRTGKEHLVAAGDPNLRPAKWWERWLLAGRFPAKDQPINGLSDRDDT